MTNVVRILQSASLIAICSLPLNAQSQDIRALGLGGAVISSGEGVGGFSANPALLMEAQRQKQRFHFRFGGGLDARDNIDVVDLLDENEDLPDDLPDEIDRIAEQPITCNPITATADTVCLSNTSTLGNLANQTLSVFDIVNGETVEGQASIDFGFAMSHITWPFSISVTSRVTASGKTDITESDRDYAQVLVDTLTDNELTLGEINDSAPINLAISATGTSVDITLPDDILTSSGETHVLQRTQLAIGMARTFDVAGRHIDVGITPKFSNHTASSTTIDLTVLDDDAFDLQDELEASEESDSSFTFDIGASTRLMGDSLIVAGVIRNVVSESVTARNDFEFETTPQLVASAMFAPAGFYRVTADLALNEAKLDNYETQRLNLGTELTAGWFDFRAGLQHDMAADNSPTTFTLGFGLGFLDLAFGLNDTNYLGGLQVAFSL